MGENTITMSVRYVGTTADSVYTGKVWFYTSATIAENDYVQISKCSSSPNITDVLHNDDLGDCDRSSIIKTIVSGNGPKHGTAAFNPTTNNLEYTLTDLNFEGTDSLQYQINCGGAVTDSAWVYYVIVNCQNYSSCSNQNVTLQMTPITDVSYYWFTTSTGGTVVPGGSNTNQLVITKNNLENTETWWVESRFRNGVTSPRLQIDVTPTIALMYWKTGALDSNWNNPANWVDGQGSALNSVPGTCTDVYIPGNAANYPLLDTGSPTCNNIYFHHGGEVGRLDLLNYKLAHIQLNLGLRQSTQLASDPNVAFSAQALDRSRWYMLSAPLKGMVSGDLSLGGYPLTYMRKFDEVNPDNATDYKANDWSTTFSSLVEPLQAGKGFAFYVNDGTGALKKQEINPIDNTQGLKVLNGVLEFPYFENLTMSKAHRIHQYNAGTRVSSFTTFKDTDLSYSDNLPVSFTRTPDSYRFIVEGSNGKFINPYPVTVNTNKTVLLGNPYMSHINFDALLTNNTGKIEPYFRIWDGTSYSVWAKDPDGQGIVNTPGMTQYIAPMQSFFVTTTPGTTAVNFDITTISSVNPNQNNKLRAGSERKNTLYVTADNGYAKTTAVLAICRNATDGYKKEEDVYKLFSNNSYVPEIFSLSNGTPIAINFLQSATGSIPLGITNKHIYKELDNTIITIDGADSFDNDVFLVDNVANKRVNLKMEKSYSFQNNAGNGILADRFRIEYATSQPTDIPQIEQSKDIMVYLSDGNVYISSTSGDLKEVWVYDIQGNLVYRNLSVGKSLLTVDLQNKATGVYIVKILTDKSSIVRKINLINK